MALVALTPGVVPAGSDNFGGQPVLQNVYAQGNFPFFGLIATGVLRTPTVAANRLLRPYPQFDNISFYTPLGQATYSSLQARFEKRFSGSFGWQVAYTFAKALTDSGGGAGSGIGGFNTPSIQNYYDLRSEKAVSPVYVTQRLVSSSQYELPFGKARRCGESVWTGDECRHKVGGRSTASRQCSPGYLLA